ncbi:mRNA capping enzyme, large subunit, partial [Rozella allomycis CSF55]
HYDDLTTRTVPPRESSSILHIRTFNNWIKSILIHKYARRGDRVLDLACGRGGDLKKWSFRNISLWVGVDLSAKSVQEATSRYESMRRKPFDAKFRACDAFSVRITPAFFDTVSCQFSLHYAFKSEESARQCMKNISYVMLPGGHFIGTIPNAEEIMIRRKAEGNSFGNEYFKITFADEEEEKKEFGCEYTFNLKEAVESVPEYLVYKETLERIAREEGLELVYWKNFTEMYYDFCAEEPFQSMLTRMNVLNKQGSIDPEDWEVIALYSSFAFKKK